MLTLKKKPKKWLCNRCKKQYCFLRSAIRHMKSLESKGDPNHCKFKEINRGEFYDHDK